MLQGILRPGDQQYEELKRAISMQKALTVGEHGQPTTGEGGFALIPQALQNTLAVATAKLEHVQFYRALPKPDETGVVSPFYEYTRQTSLGEDLEPFVDEGGIPLTEQSKFERLYAQTKYVATRRSVTNIMQMATVLSGLSQDAMNAVEIETLNGLTYLLKQVDHALFWGDEDANPLGWNGVFTEIERNPFDNVFDLRGEALTPELVQEHVSHMVGEGHFAIPDALWMPPTVKTDLAKLASQRLTYGLQNSGDVLQLMPNAIATVTDAPVQLKSDIFMKSPVLPSDSAAGENHPETAFSVGVSLSTGGSPGFSGDYLGTYSYKVVAFNAGGHSKPSVAVSNSQVPDSTNNRIVITISPETGVTVNDATYYKVYRTVKGGTGTYYYIGSVKASNTSNGRDPVTFNDDNSWIAGTEKSVLLETKPNVMNFKHVMPPVRIPLARLGLEVPFMIVMFGMPIYETPTKIAVVKNIGRVV